jgi:hypothetical protein
MTRLDDQISRGFDAGNYANAYETTDLDRALAKLSMNRAKAYVAAFTLGFLSDRSDAEMDPHVEAYENAFALVGARALALGIAVNIYGLEGEDTHTRMNYGEIPNRHLFSQAFDARCPDGTFSFGNDPYVGNDTLTESQLWSELQAQYATWGLAEHAADCPAATGDGECTNNGSQRCPGEAAGDWCSAVLGILGFEWI